MVVVDVGHSLAVTVEGGDGERCRTRLGEFVAITDGEWHAGHVRDEGNPPSGAEAKDSRKMQRNRKREVVDPAEE